MYATVDDMIARYAAEELIQLSDEAELGQIDEARVTSALGDATAVIDSYISGTYQLPLSPVPAALAMYTCQIARYLLHKNAAPEKVKADYDAAIDWLKKVASGAVKLQVAGVEAPGQVIDILTGSNIVADRREAFGGF